MIKNIKTNLKNEIGGLLSIDSVRTRKIYSRLSGKPVFFVYDLTKTPNDGDAYCDGEILKDPKGSGTINDVYCILKDGTEVSMADFYDAYMTIFGHGGQIFHPFCNLITEKVQSKTDISEFGFTETEKVALQLVLAKYINIVTQLWGEGKLNPREVQFGMATQVADFDKYIECLKAEAGIDDEEAGGLLESLYDDTLSEEDQEEYDYCDNEDPERSIGVIETGITGIKAYSDEYDSIIAITSETIITDALSFLSVGKCKLWLEQQLEKTFQNSKFEITKSSLKKSYNTDWATSFQYMQNLGNAVFAQGLGSNPFGSWAINR